MSMGLPVRQMTWCAVPLDLSTPSSITLVLIGQDDDARAFLVGIGLSQLTNDGEDFG